MTPHAAGTVLAVRAQPGARKNAVLGDSAGALRVAVSAAPEKGKANAAIVGRAGRGAIGCKAFAVASCSGETSRQKKFLVSGLTVEELRAKLNVYRSQPLEGIPMP